MSLDLEKLVKLLNLSTSDNPHEALLVITKANEIVKKVGLTWDEILLGGKKSKEEVPDWKKKQKQDKEFFQSDPRNNFIVSKIFSWLERKEIYASTFIESLKSQYVRKGYLSSSQLDSLVKIYESVREKEERKNET